MEDTKLGVIRGAVQAASTPGLRSPGRLHRHHQAQGRVVNGFEMLTEYGSKTQLRTISMGCGWVIVWHSNGDAYVIDLGLPQNAAFTLHCLAGSE
ncbi:hypothetical protein [Dokdonella sp.]|uniref:hypothetical protein n=1 Tax=Dokdonella sp. TaxID=2291710 RepID=UPI003C40E1D5